MYDCARANPASTVLNRAARDKSTTKLVGEMRGAAIRTVISAMLLNLAPRQTAHAQIHVVFKYTILFTKIQAVLPFVGVVFDVE